METSVTPRIAVVGLGIFMLFLRTSPASADKEGAAKESVVASSPCDRDPLRVILYPFLPAKDAYFRHVEADFEEHNPTIDLQVVDLSGNYYDESLPGAVTNTPADVIELDSVFLDDFIGAGRVLALPRSWTRPSGTFLDVAQQAVVSNGTTYGVPHWVCSNFLFSRRGDSLNPATLHDLVTQLGNPHGADQGLLIDLKGRSTLGEWYLDSLLDRYKTLAAASSHLSVSTADNAVYRDLKAVRQLCDSNLCRADEYHEMMGFYSAQFARRRGRALAGYSERLYYVGSENLNDCRKGECVDLDEIKVNALPLSDSGSHAFAWVDSFVVSKSCSDRCRRAARAFVSYMSDPKNVRATLTPGYGEAPRYLLPALQSLYSDRALLAVAPHYSTFLLLIVDSVPVRSPHLNRQLREIGGFIDRNVLLP